MKMQSNTKLTQDQKDWLKIMSALHPEIQFAIVGKTTFAFERQGDIIEFATAICHDAEKKNRFKVGKYYALDRYFDGHTVKLKLEDFNLALTSIHDKQYL
jgi:hypothetical protein